jgi:hypothetical protein
MLRWPMTPRSRRQSQKLLFCKEQKLLFCNWTNIVFTFRWIDPKMLWMMRWIAFEKTRVDRFNESKLRFCQKKLFSIHRFGYTDIWTYVRTLHRKNDIFKWHKVSTYVHTYVHTCEQLHLKNVSGKAWIRMLRMHLWLPAWWKG